MCLDRAASCDARCVGLLEAQAHVLEHVLELEQRRVVVGAHRPGLELEHRRPAGARAASPARARRGRPRPARRRAAPRATTAVLAAATALLITFTSWPCADRPDVHDQLAHRVEERPRALEVALLAAGHDRQRPVLGLRRGAGDRRVHEAHAALRERARRSAAPPRGPIVDMSMHSSPGRAAWRAPSSPSSTDSTCGPSTTIVMTTSQRSRQTSPATRRPRRRARRPSSSAVAPCGSRRPARTRRGAGSPPCASP